MLAGNRLLVLLPLSLIPRTPLEGLASVVQVERTIPNEMACKHCRIVFGKDSVVIGDEEHTPGKYTSALARDAQGRYYVLQDNEVPWVYDRNGRFLSAFGRLGDGPGEYRSPYLVGFGPGDSVVVLDERLRRMSFLTPANRFVRSAPAPSWTSAIVWLKSGEIVVSGVVAKSRYVGYAVHVFSSAGDHRRSFADSARAFTAEFPHLGQRLVLALSNDRLLAVTRHEQYAIEQWHPSGVLERRWYRANPWFGAYPRGNAPQAPPANVLSAIDDGAGRSWVLIRVPEKRWRQGVRERTLEDGEKVIDILEPDLISDSVIEVIDLLRGELIHQQYFDEAYFTLTAPGEVARLVEQGDGTSRVVLRTIRLVTQ